MHIKMGPVWETHYDHLNEYAFLERLPLIPGAFGELWRWYIQWAIAPVALYRAVRDIRWWFFPHQD